MTGGDVIIHYSTLALILHAVPPTQSSISPALEAARAALQANRDMSGSDVDNDYFWASYSHWVTLNAPLTPFTVVFCHVLQNHHDVQDDLKLLDSLVTSLRRSRHASQGIDKFYQLCSVFYKVAETYVRAKNQEARLLEEANSLVNPADVYPSSLQPIIGQFDGYLSQLGFVPQPMPETRDVIPTTDMDANDPAYLQDWYFGNASLYGLLEQDLSTISGFHSEQDQMWNT